MTKKKKKAEKYISPAAEFDVLSERVALVAVDLRQADKRETKRTTHAKGFAPFWSEIVDVADAEGCDTVVFGLWSHDVRTMPALTEKRLFGSSTHVKLIILESDDKDGTTLVQVWRRGEKSPHTFAQHFGSSKAAVGDQKMFIDDLPARHVGSTLVMACGETNIVKTKRSSTEIDDRWGFIPWLRVSKIKLILNPGHDYMTRPEMKQKRAIYSEGRCVLSVWNRGNKDAESAAPWTAFVNGNDATDTVVFARSCSQQRAISGSVSFKFPADVVDGRTVGPNLRDQSAPVGRVWSSFLREGGQGCGANWSLSAPSRRASPIRCCADVGRRAPRRRRYGYEERGPLRSRS